MARSMPPPLRLGAHTLSFTGDRPRIMGILNVTPDSFSDGGRYQDVDRAMARAFELAADGADIVDIGGESTRPGSHGVSTEEELARVIPVIEGLLAARLPAPISIDTSKARVAEAALTAGAVLVNDVRALADPDMAETVRRHDAAVVLMHMGGAPERMQHHVSYSDVVTEVAAFLDDATARAVAAGIPSNRIVVDPGIGFGKTTTHNLELTRGLARLSEHQAILYGPSRKSFLGELTGRPTTERDLATAAACVAAVLYGAHMVRVHEPKLVRDALRVAWALVPA